MYQNVIVEHYSSQVHLSLNIENIDRLFPGFSLGDFGVLHGSSQVQSLLPSLCVKAQLPYQLGGLETNVLFVDGGNSFKLYEVSTIAQKWKLDPTQVLERIFVSRAFTAYQLSSLVLDQLEPVIKQFKSKFVIVSNLAQLFLNRDIPKKEAQVIFFQLTAYLSIFAKKHQVILIATQTPSFSSKHNIFFKESLCERATVVVSIRTLNQRPHFFLEKHPVFSRGKAEFPSDNSNLIDFMEA